MALAPAPPGESSAAPGGVDSAAGVVPHGGTTGGAHRLALTAVTLVLFLTFLDNTIVAVVLASVQSALHAGVGALQWVVNGYALPFASLMLVFGTLGDVLGRKRIMLAGVALFCTGSILCALAPDIGMLIAGRVLMGVGAAASEPGTLSMVRHLYEDRAQRARALGVWVAVSGLALALGPVIGGTLAGLWSWRAIFWFNLVFGVIAFVIAWTALPESADPTGRRLDLGGATLAAGALAALSFAVISGETAGYRTPWIAGLFALAALGVAAFVLVEHRSPNPLVDLHFFGDRASRAPTWWRSPSTSACSPSSSSSRSTSRSSAHSRPLRLPSTSSPWRPAWWWRRPSRDDGWRPTGRASP